MYFWSQILILKIAFIFLVYHMEWWRAAYIWVMINTRNEQLRTVIRVQCCRELVTVKTSILMLTGHLSSCSLLIAFGRWQNKYVTVFTQLLCSSYLYYLFNHIVARVRKRSYLYVTSPEMSQSRSCPRTQNRRSWSCLGLEKILEGLDLRLILNLK